MGGRGVCPAVWLMATRARSLLHTHARIPSTTTLACEGAALEEGGKAGEVPGAPEEGEESE